MFRSLSLVAVALGLGALISGCRVRARATTPPPPAAQVQLAAIGPNAWVVTDYQDPVFFADDYYWRYAGGRWYRSSYLGGWTGVSVGVVPRPIVRIDRPRRYRYYHPARGARVRVAPHYRRGRRVIRRDRRQRRRVHRRGRRAVRRDGRQTGRVHRRGRRQGRRDVRSDRRQRRRGRPAARGAEVRSRSGRGRATGASVRVRP